MLCPHVIADFLRIPQQAFFLDHIERGQRGGDADRIAAERRSVRTGNPVHDFGLADDHAERHAGGNALGAANDVRMHAGVLDRPPLAGAAHAGLHFVHHQQDAVLVANAAQFLHEDGRSDNVSAFALDWLHENCRDFFRRERRLEQLVFDEAGAAERESFGVLRPAFATTVDIGIAHVRHARNQRRETALLLRL